MVGWNFVDDQELECWKGACICMTWQHFVYGATATAARFWVATSVRSNFFQGDGLIRTCKRWAPTWQKQMAWQSASVSTLRETKDVLN